MDFLIKFWISKFYTYIWNMGNTYSKINLHIVFAVKNRDSVLRDEWRDELFSYIGGIIKNSDHTPVIVGGWRDHIHILIRANISINIPALVREIKLATNKWVQSKMRCKFNWQDGYGCFSVSETHTQQLINYIANQPIHHSRVNLKDEFAQLLSKNNIVYERKYIPLPEDINDKTAPITEADGMENPHLD